MLTLILLRHAKSSWDHTGLSDSQRPLAKRGIKAAPEIGAALARLDTADEGRADLAVDWCEARAA